MLQIDMPIWAWVALGFAVAVIPTAGSAYAAYRRYGVSFLDFYWRAFIIVGVAAIAIAETCIVYLAGGGHNPVTFFGAVFTAWIGGLALFGITGIVVAIISLSRPENESYDARARILFRKQTGKHIDYAIEKIKESVEHYGESL